ncbi:MAG TPA: TonB-dependent receptor [Telluria sp.]
MIPRRRLIPSLLSSIHRRHVGALGAAVANLALLAQPAGAQTAPAPTAAQPVKGAAAAPAPADRKPASATPPATTPTATPAAASAAGPAASAAPVDTVTVTGTRSANRVDRQVYDVKSDPGVTNNSAADALNNVPSVAVTPDGTVTLRGSSNVQILIDGKPSAMMQGDNRGAALSALPADDIESVEVINNPGAQFGNEGGGQILNLVMRRNRRPGGFAAVNANYGSAGRYNSSLNGSYNTGRFGFQGSANIRHDGRDSVGGTDRTRISPATGLASRSTQSAISTGLNDSAGFNASLTYNLTENDTLGASAAYMKRDNDNESRDRYVDFGQDAIADSDYGRVSLRTGDSKNLSAGVRWDHKGAIRGELIKTDLRLSSSDNVNNSAYANTYTLRPPGRRDTMSRQDSQTENRLIDLTGDYERPSEGGGMLKLGYKVSQNRNTFDTRYLDIDPATSAEVVNPSRTNRFGLDETNIALYGSYQLRLGDNWGVLGGLRAEHTRLDINQFTSFIHAENSYTSYIPSFFITYNLGKNTDIRLSYAHRLRRPTANDLNPFVVYRDEFNVSSGNPNLMPTETDSLELGLETKFGAVDTNLRAYYRHDTDLISERRYFISDTVLLTTRDNEGSNTSGGLEFTLSGKLLPRLTVNTSGNLAYTQQRTYGDNLGAPTNRSATSLSGRVRVGYQFANNDNLSVMVFGQGKTLFGQGYRQPNATTIMSYRHNLTPALALVATITDVFDKNKMETITDTELLRETSFRRFDGRIWYLGLSYRFGGFAGMGERPGGPRGGMGHGRGPEGGGPGGFGPGPHN